MSKSKRTPHRKSAPKPAPAETPVGATRKAFDRPLEGQGPPGSGAGPRHAADDIGSDNETYGRTDTTRTPASEPITEPDALEKQAFAGPSGGAVGGTPAQLRSAERDVEQDRGPDSHGEDARPAPNRMPVEREGMMRLTGFDAIEYAEKQGLRLNKHPDSITGPRVDLTVAEATALADDDADLIWLDVVESEYHDGPPSNYEPDY